MTRTAISASTARLMAMAPAIDAVETVAGFMTQGPSDNKKLKSKVEALTEALKVAVARKDDRLVLALARRLGMVRPVYATYLPIGTAATHGGTCPETCAYISDTNRRGVICYAGAGNVALWSDRAATVSMNIIVESASRPVDAIVRHAVGGNPSPAYVAQMHAAGATFPGQDHFTYVHDFAVHARPDPISAPNVAVNASCDTATDLGAAITAGFDAVIVAMPVEWNRLIDRGGSAVATVPAPDGTPIETRVVACPEQRPEKAITCANCTALCRKPGRFDPQGRPVVVAFNSHGATRLIRAATLQRRIAVDGRLAIVE